MNSTLTQLKRRTIRKKIHEKLMEMSNQDEYLYEVNLKDYGDLMDHSVEDIKKYLKEHNKQYWNGSKKRYQVLYLMKLRKEKQADEIAICSSPAY
jgi:ABC-type Zn2+ transport system substrate-binding protein/surface adhesin